ncbi:glutaredoxin domain-containing protein [uncultured Lacinutrix sp.]|uniref:glutaredoxin family protein n=1 Tax=uncultured Lacinutrix sp. TaxID=574032 RepID=UPI002609C0B5|nr:glutaredoxin domain-containing protein [uncultured Lacinutrix sp.]
MKQIIVLFFVFLITLNGLAQTEHKYVKLSEEKKGKRLTLYATNTDSISYDLFLKVETKDYRRSSNRPIIRTIAANNKIKLLTLIQLTGTKGKYKSIFVVNEVAYALEVNKDHEGLDFKLDRAIKDKKVTLFTKDDCIICPDTKRILETNNIAYTEYNIDKDSTNYLRIIKEFQADKKNRFENRIPLLKVNNQVFNNIKSTEDFIGALREAFN